MATVVTTSKDAARVALWRSAQLFGLVLTGLLIAGLWLDPQPTLRLLWYAVIPLLPAVFLVHPALWRNVCPLATLNMLPGRRSRGMQLDARAARWAAGLGFALLAGLVPARRFLFNTDGQILAIVIIAVALLALTAGFLFDRKAGFCNSICPVLPVEKLYGQDPIADVSNPHCSVCTRCTARACLDVAPRKAALSSVRHNARDQRPWLRSAYGVFAAAFPGFIVSYSMIPNTTLDNAASVYLAVGFGSSASFVLVFSLASLLRVPARSALPLLGIAALLLYYWFAASAIAAEWQLGTSSIVAVRTLAFLLAGYWLIGRFRAENRSRAAA